MCVCIDIHVCMCVCVCAVTIHFYISIYALVCYFSLVLWRDCTELSSIL